VQTELEEVLPVAEKPELTLENIEVDMEIVVGRKRTLREENMSVGEENSMKR